MIILHVLADLGAAEIETNSKVTNTNAAERSADFERLLQKYAGREVSSGSEKRLRKRIGDDEAAAESAEPDLTRTSPVFGDVPLHKREISAQRAPKSSQASHTASKTALTPGRAEAGQIQGALSAATGVPREQPLGEGSPFVEGQRSLGQENRSAGEFPGLEAPPVSTSVSTATAFITRSGATEQVDPGQPVFHTETEQGFPVGQAQIETGSIMDAETEVQNGPAVVLDQGATALDEMSPADPSVLAETAASDQPIVNADSGQVSAQPEQETMAAQEPMEPLIAVEHSASPKALSSDVVTFEQGQTGQPEIGSLDSGRRVRQTLTTNRSIGAEQVQIASPDSGAAPRHILASTTTDGETESPVVLLKSGATPASGKTMPSEMRPADFGQTLVGRTTSEQMGMDPEQIAVMDKTAEQTQTLATFTATERGSIVAPPQTSKETTPIGETKPSVVSLQSGTDVVGGEKTPSEMRLVASEQTLLGRAVVEQMDAAAGQTPAVDTTTDHAQTAPWDLPVAPEQALIAQLSDGAAEPLVASLNVATELADAPAEVPGLAWAIPTEESSDDPSVQWSEKAGSGFAGDESLTKQNQHLAPNYPKWQSPWYAYQKQPKQVGGVRESLAKPSSLPDLQVQTHDLLEATIEPKTVQTILPTSPTLGKLAGWVQELDPELKLARKPQSQIGQRLPGLAQFGQGAFRAENKKPEFVAEMGVSEHTVSETVSLEQEHLQVGPGKQVENHEEDNQGEVRKLQAESSHEPIKSDYVREREQPDNDGKRNVPEHRVDVSLAETRLVPPEHELPLPAEPKEPILDLLDRFNAFPKLVDSIQTSVREERSEVRIQLKPDDLGQLKIKLSIERGLVKAEFIVENEAVRQVIASQLPQLHTALQERGTQVAEMMVNIGFGEREHEEGPPRKQQQSGQQSAKRMMGTTAPLQSNKATYLGRNVWNQVDVKA